MKPALLKRICAELLGTALLLAVVVGSGIMGEQLAAGNLGVALLANSLATGAGLIALIHTFGAVSGAHFNPAVSLVALRSRELKTPEFLGYVIAQSAGALLGVWAAHLMFAMPLLQWSTHDRSGWNLAGSEFIATFGLIAVIQGCSKSRPESTPYSVAAYITSAYWFTSSTSFANPAVTLARSMTNTFAGIQLSNVLLFVIAQFAGALTAMLFFKWLLASDKTLPKGASA